MSWESIGLGFAVRAINWLLGRNKKPTDGIGTQTQSIDHGGTGTQQGGAKNININANIAYVMQGTGEIDLAETEGRIELATPSASSEPVSANVVDLGDQVTAAHQGTNFRVHGISGYLEVFFPIQNNSDYELALTGHRSGDLQLDTGERYPNYWSIAIAGSENKIPAHGVATLVVARPLELNLAAEFAYAEQRGENVNLDFSQMDVELKGRNAAGSLIHSNLTLLKDVVIEVPTGVLIGAAWERIRNEYHRTRHDPVG